MTLQKLWSELFRPPVKEYWNPRKAISAPKNKILLLGGPAQGGELISSITIWGCLEGKNFKPIEISQPTGMNNFIQELKIENDGKEK